MDFVFKEIAAWQGSRHKHAEFPRRASNYPWTLCILPLLRLQPHWSLSFPSVPGGVWGLQEPFQKSARAKLLSKQQGFIYFSRSHSLTRGQWRLPEAIMHAVSTDWLQKQSWESSYLWFSQFWSVKQCYSSQYIFFYFGHRDNFYKLCYLC